MVVVGIKNRAQNDASGPGHARVPLTRYLHVLWLPGGKELERTDCIA